LTGILREQFMRNQRTVRTSGDDIGKGAATIDPELPALTSLWIRV
jgi:hypothetical protein